MQTALLNQYQSLIGTTIKERKEYKKWHTLNTRTKYRKNFRTTGEDGFLVLDRNGNKNIDNGSELFGDSVIMANGNRSSSGFEALSELDENEDGVINEDDAVFGDLRVWVDANNS